MNVAFPTPWTVERFLDWAAVQEEPYEFDGSRPVAMTGGNARHSRITINILAALQSRLRGTSCAVFGPDLGVRTIGSAVRYPDALITCTAFPDTERLAPGVRVVFEVLSPKTERIDRSEKMREYAAVESIRRYVLIETVFAGLLVLHRTSGEEPWIASPLAIGETLDMPEVAVCLPMAEIYQGVTLPPEPAGDGR